MATSLQSGIISLCPIEESDLPTLHIWRNETDFLSLFSPRRAVVSYEKFLLEHKRDIERERHLQFMVKVEGRNSPFGTVYSYNFNLVDGYVYVGGYMPNGARGFGYGALACALLISYLFEFFPLHKVYLDVLGHNKMSLPMLQSFGFVEEGRLKQHRFYNGQRHDLITMAVYREHLDKVRHLLSRFASRRRVLTK